MSNAFHNVSCLGDKSQSGLEPFPLPAMHRAEAKGLFGEHLHCCSAGAGMQVSSWASSLATCEAEHFRLTPSAALFGWKEREAAV